MYATLGFLLILLGFSVSFFILKSKNSLTSPKLHVSLLVINLSLIILMLLNL